MKMAIRYPEMVPFGSLYNEINNIFRELFKYDPAAERALETMEIPAVDIYETDKEIMLDVEVPGVNPDNFKVTFSNGKLIIEGAKEENIEEGRLNYLCMERSFGRFHRIISINRAVDLKNSEATYHQGILTIRFPKMPEKRRGEVTLQINAVDEPEGEIE